MEQKTYGRQSAGFLLIILLVMALAMTFAPLGCAQNPQSTVVKRVSVQQNGEISGAKLFQTYCAVCHGTNAKGNGPAAPALKSIPPDLTALAKYNRGNFPGDHVLTVLSGQGDNTAHGSKEMPMWGPLFRSMASESDEGAYLRARNVTEYLRSIQER
jgi:mono/diheme cytochrome c family protein